MKLTILANVPLDEKGLQEVRELGLEVEVKKTTATIKTKYNPYFKSTWGDFDWIRSQFTEPTDVKAFVTSKKELKAEGITGHIGMYDMADGDTKHDLYIGLPASLDRRAKRNGFKSNLAWLLCHEICHGEEKSHPGPDRTHSMDEQGDLLSLWEEHRLNRTALEQRKNLLGTIVELLKRLSAYKPPAQLIHPVSEYSELISQAYGVANKEWYPVTGRHVGIDYACPAGTPVKAPFSGEVIVSGTSNSMGNFCYFKYTYQSQVYVTRFMHLSSVPARDTYSRGEVLAKTGNTGNSTGPHLHIDIWHDEVRLDLINKSNWNTLTVDPYEHYSQFT